MGALTKLTSAVPAAFQQACVASFGMVANAAQQQQHVHASITVEVDSVCKVTEWTHGMLLLLL
jgi:hypothetical protein